MNWEVCKIKIKEISISKCTKKQAIKKNMMKDIKMKLEQKEQELIDSNFNQNIQIERDNFAGVLHNIVEEQTEGANISYRARWVEDGEKSTKYFYSLEKKEYFKQHHKTIKN